MPRPRIPARLFEVFSKEDCEKSNFAKEEDLQWFRDAKYGMFVHFGLSTFKNAELSWGVCGERKAPDVGSAPYPTAEWTAWKNEFHLPDFDAEKLVRHAQDAGMKYIVVIAKHHDGFHMWDAENLTRMIRELQPGILINNRTNLPGDFDTPEHRIGMFQNHRPWESCMTVCKTWSYSETPTKSPKGLVRMLVGTLTGDGNLLLSWGPKWSGVFAADQVAALKDAGDWARKNEAVIFETRGGPWHPAEWGGSVHRDKSVYLHVKSRRER